MKQTRGRIVVFGDDWGRHPSSMQHMVRHLLADYTVDWVNTIGTRLPKLTMDDMRRVGQKLRSFTRGPESGPGMANLRLHSPPMLPRLRTRAERALNGAMLERALVKVLHRPEPTAVIAMSRVASELARRTSYLNWIYYCADDLAEWPGLDNGALEQMELELLPAVRRILVVSENLQERMRRLGRASELLTHGVDVEHWAGVTGRTRTPQQKPRALYFGLADRRLDVETCLQIAARAELVFVGPTQAVDPRLQQHPSIRWVGKVPYADLPRLANHADVLVMPYADLPVTRAMQPLKLKEYLATKMPVVVTPLPANVAWSDTCDVVYDPRSFAAIVVERALNGLPASHALARQRVAGESWASKARQLEACFWSSLIPPGRVVA